jgi:hypothetical protein
MYAANGWLWRKYMSAIYQCQCLQQYGVMYAISIKLKANQSIAKLARRIMAVRRHSISWLVSRLAIISAVAKMAGYQLNKWLNGSVYGVALFSMVINTAIDQKLKMTKIMKIINKAV